MFYNARFYNFFKLEFHLFICYLKHEWHWERGQITLMDKNHTQEIAFFGVNVGPFPMTMMTIIDFQ